MKDIASENKILEWVRPWNIEKFNDLENRDERFFSILTKGVLGYLTRTIVLYNKSLRHYIFNTGSSYMYMESNGYEYKIGETTGEDQMYNHLPRCIVTLGEISSTQGELSQPHARGVYERKEGDIIRSFSAEIRRLPISVSITCQYVMETMNEMLVLVQELLDKCTFQKYFTISYLGQKIECSIQMPEGLSMQLNKIDMTAAETNLKTLEVSFTVNTNYPIINTRSEIPTDKIIREFNNTIETFVSPDIDKSIDVHEYKYPKDFE